MKIFDKKTAENTALNFSKLLLNKDYTTAYSLLSPQLQKSVSVADLEKTYADMVGNFKTPANNAEIIEVLTDWPDKQAHDVLWAYVSIDNKTTNAEAVTLTLEHVASKVQIRQIEWGRP